MKTIIISDLHLGSPVCESKKLLKFIENLSNVDKLIINGDLFDNLDFRRLPKSHWKILSYLRRLSKSIEIIWIRGNHDGDSEIVSHLIGLDFKNEYIFESGNKKILCLHGDRFDKFIDKYPKASKIADTIYRIIQKFDKKIIPSFIKKKSKAYVKCYENICGSAIEYAKKIKADIVCVGHTHYATKNLVQNIMYCNSGCWTDSVCSYITIVDGEAGLFHYKQKD
jgi:putative phosphoesterase